MRGNSQKAQRILRISTGARVDAREVPRSIPGSRLPVMQIDYIRLSRVILRIAAPVRFARCAAGERRSFDGKPTCPGSIEELLSHAREPLWKCAKSSGLSPNFRA